MGNYIGRDVPYGQFDTQVLTPNSVSTTFNLTYKVSTASSIIVVLAGSILQPNVAYSLSGGGTQIVFNTAPTTGSTLYITYLGRELGTAPVSGVNTGDQNIFSTISIAGQSNVVADTTSDTLTLVAGSGVSLTTNSTTDTITISASGLQDGDKGDITVSNTGATWTIDPAVVSYAKIQNVTGSRLLGRASGTTGSTQEITLGSNLFFTGTTLNVSNSFADGSASTPSIFFTNNVNTGIYRSGSNQLSVTTGGVERLTVDSYGRIRINDDTTSSESSILRVTSDTSTGTLTAARFRTFYAGDVSIPPVSIHKYDADNTTSQVYLRFVQGIGTTATGSGQIVANGANAAAFGSYSDISLKKNIVPLGNELSKVLALKPVKFDYKDGSGHQIGFIAQDVQKVYPDLVSSDENGLLMLADLNKNDARLIKAIQELNAKVEALEERVAELEA